MFSASSILCMVSSLSVGMPTRGPSLVVKMGYGPTCVFPFKYVVVSRVDVLVDSCGKSCFFGSCVGVSPLPPIEAACSRGLFVCGVSPDPSTVCGGVCCSGPFSLFPLLVVLVFVGVFSVVA